MEKHSKGTRAWIWHSLPALSKLQKKHLFPAEYPEHTVIDKWHSLSFGLTQEETSDLLKYYGRERNDEVKSFYGGYPFGYVGIYNPWSVLSDASSEELQLYWIDTSTNKLI
jgi:hypothetical protein